MTGGSPGAEISQEKKKEFKTASSDDQRSAISVMPVLFTETDKQKDVRGRTKRSLRLLL